MRFAGLWASLGLFTSALDAEEPSEVQKAYQQALASAAEVAREAEPVISQIKL